MHPFRVERAPHHSRLWKPCSQCGELHDRGARYSYCRKCQTAYERNRRLKTGTVRQQLIELRARMSRLELLTGFDPKPGEQPEEHDE